MFREIAFRGPRNWSFAVHRLAQESRRMSDGSNRVMRGGSWDGEPRGVRSAFRYTYAPSSRGSFVGLRLVRKK